MLPSPRPAGAYDRPGGVSRPFSASSRAPCWPAGSLILPAGAASAAQAAPAAAAAVANPASLVNPFIGTTNQGDDFSGADAPFGMVQWSPDMPSRPDGGGYEYNDSSITGFSLNRLSAPGCGTMGDVPVPPTVGTVNTSATDSFSHSNESASAGVYQVGLNNGVTTTLTATPSGSRRPDDEPRPGQRRSVKRVPTTIGPVEGPPFVIPSA